MPDVTYTPYYPDGWDDSPDTSTPILAAALDTVDAGITAATGQANAGLDAANAETARAEAAEALKAPLASPAFTGTPTAPTASAQADNTQVATTAYTDAAVAVETSRAETAEALKAPLASPALTGSPTSPTQTTGDTSTKIATDAFVATAVAAETTRAEAAEALALQKSANLSDLANAAAARTNLGLGSAATQPSSAFDASGAATAAQSAAEAYSSPTSALGDTVYGGASGVPTRLPGNTTAAKKFQTQTGTGTVSAAPAWSLIATSDLPDLSAIYDVAGAAAAAQGNAEAFATAAVATETGRAETAEALLAPLASPTFTGTPTAPTKTALTSNTDIATTAYADAAVAVESSRAETAEALALAKASNLSDVATRQTALNNLTGTQSAGKVLRSDGTNATLAAIQAGDVPTLNQNTTGAAASITGTLDQVPAPAAAVFLNSKKITSLANGSAAQDAAAFGQIPVIETTSSNIKPIAAAAALGSSGKPPNSDHVHAWGQTAPASYAPSNPTGTTSTTQVMMGFGATCAFTPTGSGLVLVTICGTAKTTVAQQPVTIGARFGTGTAPSNGAAVTGTRIGPASDTVISGSGAGSFSGFTVTTVLTLTPATAYWFDLAIQTGNAADTASVAAVTMTLVELP